jgi:hypothetical protein
MRLIRSLTSWAWFSTRVATAPLAVLILSVAGCGDGLSGGPPPKTEAELARETKVQALLKEGKSLSDGRAIMRGDPLPSKGKKKAARKH